MPAVHHDHHEILHVNMSAVVHQSFFKCPNQVRLDDDYSGSTQIFGIWNGWTSTFSSHINKIDPPDLDSDLEHISY